MFRPFIGRSRKAPWSFAVPSAGLKRSARLQTTVATPPTAEAKVPERGHAWLYFNGAYPLRLSRWDFRQVVSNMENDFMVDRLKRLVNETQSHEISVDEVQPRAKDGGAFVKLSFNPTSSSPELCAEEIRKSVEDAVKKKDYKPWWLLGPSGVFRVKGSPWLEDMDRWPHLSIRVEFEGGDIPQEQLWELVRPFGRIKEIYPPATKDLPRSSTVVFSSIRSATAARNCLHGYVYTSRGGTQTTIRILYNPRMHARAARDWVAGHPKIVLPVLAILLGGLSYTLFDPIRSFFIKAHISGLFDVAHYRIISWLKTETLGRLGMSKNNAAENGATLVEKERKDAAKQVSDWLGDKPETFITVTGPNGSGKGPLVDSVLKKQKNVLVIDCEAILKASTSDAKLVSSVASSVGYWPQFAFLANASNMIDLASVGLIGQKAGFATSIDQQLKQVLDVTAVALKQLADKATSDFDKAVLKRSAQQKAIREHPAMAEKVQAGDAHDGRLAVVAGTGVVSELGAGVEKGETTDDAVVGPQTSDLAKLLGGDEITDPPETDIRDLPVVIMKGFYSKDAHKDTLWDALAEFAAKLVENEIAHVIFTSENVAAGRPLAKVLPSRPLNTIILTDASPENARQFVSKKLASYGQPDILTSTNQTLLEHLGGRLTDLETLVQKIRSGVPLEEAVEDIVSRSATEIKKNCFGDSEEAARGLGWSREQAWFLTKGLAEKDELLYNDVLVNKFSGDDSKLAALEATELISVLHRDNNESVIRCGKPVYRSAVKRLCADKHFSAMNDLRSATSAIAKAETEIRTCSEQLISLGQLFHDGMWSFGGGYRVPGEIQWRVDQLLGTMREAEEVVAKMKKVEGESKEKLKERVTVTKE